MNGGAAIGNDLCAGHRRNIRASELFNINVKIAGRNPVRDVFDNREQLGQNGAVWFNLQGDPGPEVNRDEHQPPVDSRKFHGYKATAFRGEGVDKPGVGVPLSGNYHSPFREVSVSGPAPEGVIACCTQGRLGLLLLLQREVGFLGQEHLVLHVLEPFEDILPPLSDIGNGHSQRGGEARLIRFGRNVEEGAQCRQV